ncbi:hypothetical protein NZ47_10955 [Anaerovibrio lipolyticus]|uniref:Uncharacterized protein n=1 Tax=Anaerovibrio lipolyticus TaxID=82374 RepID=A0A0B2JXC9_9FIRM|nr:hypothetical protein [Anaerovibrio lipolyticus]KHM51363.1 hypothetical protein NZ47_10955 [Anaerovibrio lipolyticus]
MVLYRPRAKDYTMAMQNLKIFDTPLDMEKYLVHFHNLYNLLDKPDEPYILVPSKEEKADHRNGWLHSRYVLLGNVPLGIFDYETLDRIKKPRLEIEDDGNGGLKCQFEILDEGYIFFLGSDQWYGHTTMLGYKRSDMTAPCARVDDIAVNPDAFTQALEHFIAERAIKIVEVQKKIQERKYEKKRA